MSDLLFDPLTDPDILGDPCGDNIRWHKICHEVRQSDEEFWHKWDERNKQQWWETMQKMPKELKAQMLEAYHKHPETYRQQTSKLVYDFYNPPKQVKPRWRP